VAYPTGTAVSEQVIAALKTRLETIATPAYKNTVRTVLRYSSTNVAQVHDFPAIIISPQSTQVAQTVAGIVSNDMSVTLRAAIADRETHGTTLNSLEADIRAALYSDIQLGGVCCWLRIATVETFELLDEQGAMPAIDVGILIHYRHRLDDPNTAA
jgi:hypothetical protein